MIRILREVKNLVKAKTLPLKGDVFEV